jgi:hypothetical protein
MRKIAYILFLCICFNVNAQPPSKWYNKFGGYGVDIGYGIKETYKRNYIAVGSTSSFDVGSIDAYMVLIDSMGVKVWEKTFGGALADVAKSVIVNPVDSGFIFAGYTSSFGFGGYDVYVVRTDKNGNMIWQKSFGAVDWDFGNEIVLAPDGNVIICGYTYSMGYGKKDGYLLKVNSTNGGLMWQKYYGGAEDDEFRSLRIIASSTLVLTGETKSYNDVTGDIYFLKTDLNGDSLLYRSYGLKNEEDFGNSIIQNIYLNGYVIAGGTESYSTWGKDAFIFGISGIGDSLWLVNYGNPNYHQEAIDVVATITNTFQAAYVLSYSDVDLPVFKRNPKNLLLDANGIYYTGNAFGSYEDEELTDLSNATDKGFIGIGYTRGFGAADQDVFVVKYDSTAFYGGNLIGINEGKAMVKDHVRIFPSVLTNEFPVLTIESDKEFYFFVYDLYGKQILGGSANKDPFASINLKDLSPGIYMINVKQGQKSSNFKIIKRD